jgi:hypothetical protein
LNPKPQNNVLAYKSTYGQKKWALHPKEKRKDPWRTNQPTNQPTQLNCSPKGHSTFIHIEMELTSMRKFGVCVESTLYPLISLLESGRDIMPTYRCKNPPTVEELA